jgi:hypothetical protein
LESVWRQYGQCICPAPSWCLKSCQFALGTDLGMTLCACREILWIFLWTYVSIKPQLVDEQHGCNY